MASALPDGSIRSDLTDGERPPMLAYFSDCPMHGLSMFSYIFTITGGIPHFSVKADTYKCCVEECDLLQAEVRN